MDRRTVRDVLGGPESWPNVTAGFPGIPNPLEAVIVQVVVMGAELMIITNGGSAAPAVSTFVISDPFLLDALVDLLTPGLKVHEVVSLEI